MRHWVNAFREEGRPVLWIACRSAFASVVQFQETLREAGISTGFEWRGVPFADLQSHMMTDFAALKQRPVLVIEDAQYLPPDAIEYLTMIIGNARDSLTTILSSRNQTAIPVARLRSLGYLTEVGVDELRFSSEETAGLIAAMAREPVDVQWSHIVHHSMAGWPAGTMMVACFPVPRDIPKLRNDAGLVRLRENVRAYFEEEVLLPMQGEMRQFLTDISILDRIDRHEAMAITTRGDAGAFLTAAVRQGLFIDIVDGEAGIHAMHPLFRELMHDRLLDRDAARASLLHKRAANYYLSRGQRLAAVEQADASGDLNFLAETLEDACEALTYEGHLPKIVTLAEKLPWTLLSRRPGIMLCVAWRKIRALAFPSAEYLLAAVETQLDRMRKGADCDAPGIARLDLLLRHRRSLLAAARDDMPLVERLSEELLGEFGDDNGYISCTLLAQLMAARRELFHFHDTLKLEAETRRALGRPGSRFASIALKAAVAPTLAVQGKTAAARELLEQSLEMARAHDGIGSGLAALPALPLAELHYDMGDLARARDLVDHHLSAARELGYTDQLCAGHLVRARLLAAEGNVSAALAVLEEAHLVALECGLDRLRSFAMGLQVQILLREGHREAAAMAYRAAGFDQDVEPVPTMTPSRCQEAGAIAWVRLEIRQHRLVRARRIARRWQELAKRSGAIRSVVLFDLLLAEIAVLGGEASEARRHIRSAAAAAAEPGWVRIFIDAGEVVGKLLLEAYGDSPQVDNVVDRFAAGLLERFGLKQPVEADDESESGLGDRIAGREIEILSLVSGGLRNREIGNRLGLTEGTVKWYMQQIYDKLGVRRRPQAVLRARALGLLG
ncbi:hypothetical protein A7Q26_02325 [Sphingobium sp. TCM1]|nr:hypothetical protein A7Q26_02325 [Sphingobium sp. TCM1]